MYENGTAPENNIQFVVLYVIIFRQLIVTIIILRHYVKMWPQCELINAGITHYSHWLRMSTSRVESVNDTLLLNSHPVSFLLILSSIKNNDTHNYVRNLKYILQLILLPDDCNP